MAEDSQDIPAVMTLEQVAAYKKELADELHELEWSQQLWPTQYKFDRIARLRERLNMPKRVWEDYLGHT